MTGARPVTMSRPSVFPFSQASVTGTLQAPSLVRCGRHWRAVLPAATFTLVFFLTTSQNALPCSRTNGGRRRSHLPPEVGRQAPPLHRPRRDPRHAHANALTDSASSPSADSNGSFGTSVGAQRTTTVVLGPRSAPSGPPAATPLTATAAAPQAPTRPGSKASTPRLVASLPTHHTSVPRSPSSSTQVGVLVSCAASQQTRTERR